MKRYLKIMVIGLVLAFVFGCAGDDDDDDDKSRDERFCDDYPDSEQDLCAFCWRHGVYVHNCNNPTQPIEDWAKECMDFPGDEYYQCLFDSCDVFNLECRDYIKCRRDC